MVKIMMVVLVSTGVYRTPENKGLVKSSPSYLRKGEFTVKNPQAWILLVDDDGGDYDNPQGDTLYPDLQSYWTQALDVYYAGEYDVYEIKENGPGPDTSVLKNYDVVIWYTGECWNSTYWSTLQIEDEQNLGIYLDSGGALLLTAQDYFYDRYPGAGNFSPGQFPYDYLGLQSVVQDFLPAFGGTFEGDSGGIFEGFSGWFNSNGIYSPNVPCWLDHITPYDAQKNLTAKDSTGSTSADVGFQRDAGTYKVIYSNLGFEVITDLNIRADMINAAIEWFTLKVEEPKAVYAGKNIRIVGNKIVYSLPAGKSVEISLFDLSGRRLHKYFLSGKGEIKLNEKTGIYILKGDKIELKTFLIR